LPGTGKSAEKKNNANNYEVKKLSIWKESDPSEALITTKLQEYIADSVILSLYMRDNEYVQHPSRPLAPA
jgi:hypothetical protein